MKVAFVRHRFKASDGLAQLAVGRELTNQGHMVWFYSKYPIVGPTGKARVRRFPVFYNFFVVLFLLLDRPNFVMSVVEYFPRFFWGLGIKYLNRTFFAGNVRWDTIRGEVAYKFRLRGWGDKLDEYFAYYAKLWDMGSNPAVQRQRHRHSFYVFTARDFISAAAEEGYPPDRLLVLETGVDLQVFTPAAAPHEGFVVGFMGLDPVRKGIVYALKAFESVHARHPETRLLVVSYDLTSLDVDGATLVNDVDYSQVSRIPGYLHQIDVLLLPSLIDGAPVQVLEAMASGVPVILSKGIGYDEFIVDGVNGFLVGKKDAKAIADCIERLVGDPVLRASMAKNARASAEQRSWAHATRAFAAEAERVKHLP